MRNRVDPYGDIIETPARGSWMGNRGLLHNAKREIVRRSRLKAWLICRLEFKNRKRAVMTPGLYTELFFFDEATALAAGHRPCCECRRNDFNLFKTLWIRANPEHHLTAKSSINEIDRVLEQERKNPDGSRKISLQNFDALPDGTFISFDNRPLLVHRKELYLWTPFSYRKNNKDLNIQMAAVLTPPSIVKTLTAGYPVQISPEK